jgi:PKD repeat protein
VPLVAAIMSTCDALTCTFDGSRSQGTVTSYVWDFGDGTTGSGAVVTHTYSAGNAYAVRLIIASGGGASADQTVTVTVTAPPTHIGDLDRSSSRQQNTWTALVTIEVHDNNHNPLANAWVTAAWDDGTAASCTTGTAGRCAVSKPGISRKATVVLAITNLVRAGFIYEPEGNHDPDGDSRGTTMSISRQW